MKHALALATLLLAACATAPGPAGVAPAAASPLPESAPRAELAEVSRAMTIIDDAERRGEAAVERARWSDAAHRTTSDLAARFLAIYAQPHDEETWSEFRWLEREYPTSAYGPLGMARIYVEWRVLDQAAMALTRAADAEPDSWLVTLVRAQADERGGKAEAAGRGYRAVLAADAANVDAHAGLARLARQAGDEAAARASAEAALAALPEHVPALRVLAELATARGDAAAATGLMQRIVAASPRDRAARVALARALEARGDAAAARDQWRAAVALREDADGLLALADASRKAGDREGERKALERLSQLDPGAAEWRRIAEARQAAGDLAGTERALRRVLAHDARDQAAHLALGRTLVQAAKTQEALEHLREGGPGGAADRAALERRLNVERVARADLDALQRAVGALIDRTYRQRLRQAPKLAGKLSLRATVEPSGAASLVEVLEDSLHDEDVRACAYWNLRDAAYPPRKPGRYSFAFALRPGR
jgi:tetratricopeptide (TPR) repeat protein